MIKKYINREISWLKFNGRVLQEAENLETPLIERLRFLGIYSNNLDEFYKVRYASIRRAAMFNDKKAYQDNLNNEKLQSILKQINAIVNKQADRFDRTYEQILLELKSRKIHLVDETNLLHEHKDFLDKLYNKKISYSFNLLILDDLQEFPEIKDLQIYLAIKVIYNKQRTPHYALIEVPTDKFPRFIVLPQVEDQKYLIYLEDIIRVYLREIFSTYDDVRNIEAHSIKITRDAKLSIDNDLRKSFVDKMIKSVSRRKNGAPVRLIYDKEIAQDTLEYIKHKMGFDEYDNFSPGAKYHNRKDLIKFPNVGEKDLVYTPLKMPQRTLKIDESKNYFDVLYEKDHVIFTPYDDYTVLLKLLRYAATDPKVTTIKMTIYRVADESGIINALINAAYNGKEVVVLIELQARFDESHNLKWAHLLQEAGAKVNFGIQGLKTHSKLGYIERELSHKTRRFAIISTGNFHEGTARLYTDYTLLTAHRNITKEVNKIFSFFDTPYDFYDFEYLIVSPKQTRTRIIVCIDNEISQRKKGKEAAINIKVNSLCDSEIIDKLYEASQAGVNVRLIVRGICSLIPQVKGLSENIEAISVIDRYLEHSRVYWFHNKGKNDLYISSADLMARNLDYRVEVTAPIYDEEIKSEIMNVFELFFKDNQSARLHTANLLNPYVKNKEEKMRVQFKIPEILKENDEYN